MNLNELLGRCVGKYLVPLGLLTVPCVQAADGVWNVDADGNWSDTTNWTGGIVADGTDSTATFDGISGNWAVTVDGSRTIGNVTFDDGSHHLEITGDTLTFDTTSGTPTIDVDNEELTITSVVAGDDGLKKVGAGVLRLDAANTFTGGIDLSEGFLYIRSSYNPDSFGDTSNVITFTGDARLHNVAGTFTMAQGIHINDGVTGEVTGAFGERTFVEGPLTGSGTLKVQGFSADFQADFRNTANTFTGPIVTQSGDSMTLRMASLSDSADSASTVGLFSSGDNGVKFEYMNLATSPLVLNIRRFELIGNGGAGGNASRQPKILNNAGGANTMTINTDLLITGTGGKKLHFGGSNSGDNTFAGDIPDAIDAGVLEIFKENGGKWIFAGNNTYKGATSVQDGTLLVNGDSSGATGDVNVTGDAVLGGSGTVGGAINATSTSSTIAPGTSIGTFSTTSDATINGTLEIEIDGASADQLAVSGDLTLGGASILDVSEIGAAASAASYPIVSYGGSLTGTFATSSGLPSGYSLDYSTPGQINLVGPGGGGSVFDTWATSNGVPTGSEAVDSDTGGLNNLGEFGLGGDPTDGNDDGSLLHAFSANVAGGAEEEGILTILVRNGAVGTFSTADPSVSATADGIVYTVAADTTPDVDGGGLTVTPTTAVTTGLPAAPAGYTYVSFYVSGAEGYFQVTVAPE